MRVRIKRLGVMLLATTSLVLGGCQSLGRFHEKMSEHPDPMVKVPTGVGNFVGAVVGVPLSLVLMPVTLPIGYAYYKEGPNAGDSDAIWSIVFIPMGVTLTGGGLILGTPFWCLFGWWAFPAGGQGFRLTSDAMEAGPRAGPGRAQDYGAAELHRMEVVDAGRAR